MPLARFRALSAVARAGDIGADVATVHRAIGRGNRWGSKWELTALEAIGLVQVEGPPEDEDPKAVRIYRLAAEYRDVYESVGAFSSSLSRENAETGPASVEPTDSYTSAPSPVTGNGRPLIGDDGFAQHLLDALERNLMTQGEVEQALAAHEFVRASRARW